MYLFVGEGVDEDEKDYIFTDVVDQKELNRWSVIRMRGFVTGRSDGGREAF